jgi:hypothetical protein
MGVLKDEADGWGRALRDVTVGPPDKVEKVTERDSRTGETTTKRVETTVERDATKNNK